MEINVSPLPVHLSSLRASAEILVLLKIDNVLKYYRETLARLRTMLAHRAKTKGKAEDIPVIHKE